MTFDENVPKFVTRVLPMTRCHPECKIVYILHELGLWTWQKCENTLYLYECMFTGSNT